MKFKIAGLCLASMFVVCMAFSATASANWEHCTKGPVGAAPTKYSEDGCSTINETSGEWNWREVNGTEEVRIKGSLLLRDNNIPVVKKVAIECSGEGIGDVGPKTFARVQEIKTSPSQCRNVENCEEIQEAEARNTSWQIELTTKGTASRTGVITNTGSGEPGWKIKCKVLGIAKEDLCTQESGKPESVLLENKNTNGELLVLATFQKLRKADCSIGGIEEGEVIGAIAILQANKQGLQVT
jgi:hypothetical protein